MLETCGFNNIDVKFEIAVRTFQSKDELFNWAFACVPHWTGLPEDKNREFTQDIVNNVCRAQKDEQLILETPCLKTQAEKSA